MPIYELSTFSNASLDVPSHLHALNVPSGTFTQFSPVSFAATVGWYNINAQGTLEGKNVKGTNKIGIRQTGGLEIIALAPGNYSAAEAATALQTALQASALTDAGNFTVVYNSITKKFTISHSDVFTVEAASSLVSEKEYRPLQVMMGFPLAGSASSASSQTSARPCDMRSIRELRVKFSTVHNITNDISTPGEDNYVFAVTPLVAFGSMFSVDLTPNGVTDFPEHGLNNIKVSVVDENNEPILFETGGWRVSFSVE